MAVRAIYKKDKITGEILKTYDSVKFAAKDNSLIDGSNIVKCCKGKQKTCGGYKWSYVKEKEEIKLKENEVFKKIGMIKGFDLRLYEISNYGSAQPKGC